jgi:hypothetical protein
MNVRDIFPIPRHEDYVGDALEQYSLEADQQETIAWS